MRFQGTWWVCAMTLLWLVCSPLALARGLGIPNSLQDSPQGHVADSLIFPNASYPRGVLLPSGQVLFCVGVIRGGVKTLQVVLGPQTVVGIVAQDSAVTSDLANCNLLLWENTTLLVAYRHHLDCSASQSGGRERGCGVFRIMLRKSLDFGATWAAPAEVDRTRPPNGLWEPFLFRYEGAAAADRANPVVGDVARVSSSLGFLPTPSLHCFYARERMANGSSAAPGMSARSGPAGRTEQDIVRAESPDIGTTWSPPALVSSSTASRNGMPGAVTLRDGSVAVVMEGFFTGAWNIFSVALVRTKGPPDPRGGWVFGPPQAVYAAPEGRNAGAPQVALLGSSGRVAVSFMTNDATPPPVPSWPAGAYVRVSVSQGGGRWRRSLGVPRHADVDGGLAFLLLARLTVSPGQQHFSISTEDLCRCSGGGSCGDVGERNCVLVHGAEHRLGIFHTKRSAYIHFVKRMMEDGMVPDKPLLINGLQNQSGWHVEVDRRLPRMPFQISCGVAG